jgi:hypothetical protein
MRLHPSFFRRNNDTFMRGSNVNSIAYPNPNNIYHMTYASSTYIQIFMGRSLTK